MCSGQLWRLRRSDWTLPKLRQAPPGRLRTRLSMPRLQLQQHSPVLRTPSGALALINTSSRDIVLM